MKKLFITLVCAAFALTVSAQRASSSSSSFFSTEKSDQSVTFGVRAGVNFSNMSFSEDGVSLSLNSHTGFNAGVVVDIPLMQSLYVQSGLFYTVKGCEAIEDDEKYTMSPSYLEIPVLASYRYDFSDAAQLQINVGPYFAYGIGGKCTRTEGGRDYDIDFFGGEDDDESMEMKRFDVGLQIGAGITLAQHYYLGVAYEFGFASMSRYDALSIKNNNFMINLGYQF